jgi:hypothetical protein
MAAFGISYFLFDRRKTRKRQIAEIYKRGKKLSIIFFVKGNSNINSYVNREMKDTSIRLDVFFKNFMLIVVS